MFVAHTLCLSSVPSLLLSTSLSLNNDSQYSLWVPSPRVDYNHLFLLIRESSLSSRSSPPSSHSIHNTHSSLTLLVLFPSTYYFLACGWRSHQSIQAECCPLSLDGSSDCSSLSPSLSSHLLSLLTTPIGRSQFHEAHWTQWYLQILLGAGNRWRLQQEGSLHLWMWFWYDYRTCSYVTVPFQDSVELLLSSVPMLVSLFSLVVWPNRYCNFESSLLVPILLREKTLLKQRLKAFLFSHVLWMWPRMNLWSKQENS